MQSALVSACDGACWTMLECIESECAAVDGGVPTVTCVTSACGSNFDALLAASDLAAEGTLFRGGASPRRRRRCAAGRQSGRAGARRDGRPQAPWCAGSGVDAAGDRDSHSLATTTTLKAVSTRACTPFNRRGAGPPWTANFVSFAGACTPQLGRCVDHGCTQRCRKPATATLARMLHEPSPPRSGLQLRRPGGDEPTFQSVTWGAHAELIIRGAVPEQTRPSNASAARHRQSRHGHPRARRDRRWRPATRPTHARLRRCWLRQDPTGDGIPDPRSHDLR